MATSTDQELLLLVGRIDGNVRALLDASAGHENRLRSLEKARWQIAGALVGLTAWLGRNHLHPLIALFS